MASRNAGAKPKIKGRHVASRYRQAAEKAASGSSDETSIFESREISHIGNRGNTTYHGVTSTPMPDNVGREFKIPTLDESSVLVTSRKGMGSTATDEFKANISKWQKKKGKKYNEKELEQEMDLLYASYLQAAFLESEAKLALKARGSNILEQIHKLLELFITKLDILSKVVSKASIISSINEICILCQKQEEILTPVFEKIPDMQEKLKGLSDAVNVNKHKLLVKDVELPGSSDENDVTRDLKNMCEMLKTFFSSVPQYENLITSCDNFKNYVELTEALSVELKRTLELILRAKQSQINEAYLKL